jgi:2-polyprenyl-6-methoxyphenol hydroxylase-like FAD-dependent oxidoreductase
LGYLLHATLPLEALQNRSPQDLINAASRLLHQASFPPLFAQLVQCSNPAQLIHRPYNIHPANLPPAEPIGDPIGDPIGNPIGDPIWSQGRVVLVGDAAHGMPPFAAQGANQGLEDAAVIGSELAQLIHANQLDNLALIAQKFQQYEQLRRPFMAQIQRATLHNHTWSQAEWEDYSDRVYGREMGLMESSK